MLQGRLFQPQVPAAQGPSISRTLVLRPASSCLRLLQRLSAPHCAQPRDLHATFTPRMSPVAALPSPSSSGAGQQPSVVAVTAQAAEMRVPADTTAEDVAARQGQQAAPLHAPSTPAAESAQPAASGGWLARAQQNMNMAGIGLFFSILAGNRSLAIPHVSVPDVSHIDWGAVKAAGFRAVVFDKDNTLTEPFQLQVPPRLQASVDACKAAFGAAGIALYSNSAGLEQYDPQGAEAAELEAALGIAVMRHKQKKPAGEAGEVAAHFGCQLHELVMVGDRYLTDVVFGNRHGMLTIRPTPLTVQGEPPGVQVARRVEEFWVGRWMARGVAAPNHPLVPEVQKLVGFKTGSVATGPPPHAAP